MSEKRVQKVRDQAATLVGSGETVRHAVPLTSGPLFALALGPLGVAFLKFRTVVLTDRALYLMTMKGMGAPKEVEQELPLGSTAVSTDKGVASHVEHARRRRPALLRREALQVRG